MTFDYKAYRQRPKTKELRKQYREVHKNEIKVQQKKYRESDDVKAHIKKNYIINKDEILKRNKKYRKSDRGKEKIKQYRQTDSYKQSLKKSQNNSETKRKQKEYRESDAGKEIIKKYQQTDSYKQSLKKSQNNAEYKKKQKEYQLSDRSKKLKTLWWNSDAGRTARNKYRVKKRATDPEYVIRNNIRSRINMVLKLYTKTGKTMTSKKYGIVFQEIIDYLKPIPIDIYNYHNHHKRPLASFTFIKEDGSTDVEELRKAFAPENHKLITKEEHNKINHMVLISHYKKV